MVTEALVGAANFVFIFLKAFQQRNVAYLHYGLVLPTSVAMAVAEIGVIGAVAIKATSVESYVQMAPMVGAVALGGGLGCLASMWIHHKLLGD